MGFGDRAFEMAKSAYETVVELRTDMRSFKERIEGFETRITQLLHNHQQDQKGEIRELQARIRELETKLAETRGDVRSALGEAVAGHLRQHGLGGVTSKESTPGATAVVVLPPASTQDS
jgi:predicted  nucleic acid-binding Zn-ribbon protein